jgi:hypothetical protein
MTRAGTGLVGGLASQAGMTRILIPQSQLTAAEATCGLHKAVNEDSTQPI